MSSVFIVDDNIVARSMLVRILTESRFEIAGESGTGQGAIIMLEEVKPDIIMLEADIGGGMSLEDVIAEIKRTSPGTKIIICSDELSRQKLIDVSELGIDDFVMKPYRKANLIRIVGGVTGK